MFERRGAEWKTVPGCILNLRAAVGRSPAARRGRGRGECDGHLRVHEADRIRQLTSSRKVVMSACAHAASPAPAFGVHAACCEHAYVRRGARENGGRRRELARPTPGPGSSRGAEGGRACAEGDVRTGSWGALLGPDEEAERDLHRAIARKVRASEREAALPNACALPSPSSPGPHIPPSSPSSPSFPAHPVLSFSTARPAPALGLGPPAPPSSTPPSLVLRPHAPTSAPSHSFIPTPPPTCLTGSPKQRSPKMAVRLPHPFRRRGADRSLHRGFRPFHAHPPRPLHVRGRLLFH